MKSKAVRLLVGAGAVLVLCSVVTALFQLPFYPKTVYRSDTRFYASTSPPTFAEMEALCDATMKHTPLPPGFVLTKSDGKVTGMITGAMPGPPPEYSINVTVYAPIEDVAQATLHLGDQVLFTATRANGAIVDRAGNALATLTGLVPEPGHFTVKVFWVGNNGQWHQEELTF